jgi:uncharacterized protein (DUF2141 family)
VKKKLVKWILVISLIFTGIAAFTSETQAAYSPYSVESSVKNGWASKIGSKSSGWTTGRRLVYDVYGSKFDRNGYSIVTENFDGSSKKYLRFYGWSVIAGYKHHTASNQSTHIVLKKRSGESGVGTTKIYKTKQGTWDATEDLEYNNQGSGIYNRCPNSATNKNNLDCNMEYVNVTFTAYIPLDDLFSNKFEAAKWEMYLVKRVDNQIVYTPLIVPFDFSKLSYNGGRIDLTSGVNANKLRMNDYPVIRRDYPRQPANQAPNVYFTNGSYYTRIDADETDTAVWYGVSYGGGKKWANTAYWTFGGDQAALTYDPPNPNLYGGETLVLNPNGSQQHEFEYGEPVTVRGYIHSDTDIGPVNHTQSLNGSWQGNVRAVDYPSSSGSTRWITKTYDDLQPGTYKVKTLADYDKRISESNETDNYSDEVTFTVKPRNLYGEDTKVFNLNDEEKYEFEYGETVRVRGYVKSNAPIGTVNHTHSLNGKWQGNVRATDYPQAQTRNITKDYKDLRPGEYTVSALADYDDRILESNENDNYTSSATFTILDRNLTAKSIEILDEDKKPIEYLTKGEEYFAKIVYQNTGETITDSHKISLEDESTWVGYVSTGRFWPGDTRTSYIKFTANNSGTRSFNAWIDSEEVILESNEDDNEIDTDVYVNTRPEITISYDPSDVYEGDKVDVCVVPTDEDDDPLEVTIEMNKRSSGYKQVVSKTGVSSSEEVCYVIDKAEVGDYEFKGTVDDGYDSSDVTISFEALPLTLEGEVEHTATWLKRHMEQGHRVDEFYSGEKFILIGNTSDYPISSLTVKMNARQERGTLYSPIIQIPHNGTVKHQTEYEDPALLETGTVLTPGPVDFDFKVVYTNGVIKTDTVTIQIIGDVYDLFRLHRRY